MAIVKDNPNGDKGTTEGMALYRFTGTPTTQYEHIPEPGERRTMTITVERSAVIEDEIKDGERTIVRWKVIEAELGKPVTKSSASDEPELDYDSGANAAYGDYGVGQPAPADAATGAEEPVESNVSEIFSDTTK